MISNCGRELGDGLDPAIVLSGDLAELAAPSLLAAWEYALTIDDYVGAADIEAQVRAVESHTGRTYPEFMHVFTDVQTSPAPGPNTY